MRVFFLPFFVPSIDCCFLEWPSTLQALSLSLYLPLPLNPTSSRSSRLTHFVFSLFSANTKKQDSGEVSKLKVCLLFFVFRRRGRRRKKHSIRKKGGGGTRKL